jgi:inosine-uridine nucleoside N-ribohydrolase
MPAARPDAVEPAPRTATVHDALCTAHLVAPVIQASERCTVDVDTGDGGRRGTADFTPVDAVAAAGAPAPGVEVVRHARPDVVVRTLVEATRRLSSRDARLP